MPDITLTVFVEDSGGSYRAGDVVTCSDTATTGAVWDGTEYRLPSISPAIKLGYIHVRNCPFTKLEVQTMLCEGDHDRDNAVWVTRRLWGATNIPAASLALFTSRREFTIDWANVKNAIRLKSNNRALTDGDIQSL